MRRFLATAIVFGLLLVPACLHAQGDGPAGERLILKDGSFQAVRSYERRGDRVRFLSAERGDWEEIPQRLIDWKATRQWNDAHAAQAAPTDPARQEAAEIDREAALRRAAERARQPAVAPGLRLPDESGVWGLDTYNHQPELVRIRQSDGDLNLDMGHSVKALAIPTHGAKDLIRLNGSRAAVSFHTLRPVFYVALDPASDSIPTEDAMVIDTHGATAAMKDQIQKVSPDSRYALVRLGNWKSERIATAQELSGLADGGSTDGSAPVVALSRKILPGNRWMRLVPPNDLSLGQYILIEILPSDGVSRGFNLDGWDFGVDPTALDNKGSLGPIFAEGRSGGDGTENN